MVPLASAGLTSGRAYALANLTYPVLGQRFLTTFAHEVTHG